MTHVNVIVIALLFQGGWWGAMLAGALGRPLSYQAAEAFYLMRFDTSWALWVYADF